MFRLTRTSGGAAIGAGGSTNAEGGPTARRVVRASGAKTKMNVGTTACTSGVLPVLGAAESVTPMIIPIRGHVDSVRRLMRCRLYIE